MPRAEETGRRLDGAAHRRAEVASGAWRARVRSLLSAAILALGALSVAAASFPGGAQRWDYWGRVMSPPTYGVAWSKDDAVCQAIVKALNHPRPGDNRQLYAFRAERPEHAPSLYRDPLFLHWTLHPLSEPLGVFPDTNTLRVSVEWMEVPFFNDSRPAIALRITYPGGSDAPQALYVIPDVDYFKTLTWKMEGEEFAANPRILRPLKPFISKQFSELFALPKTMKNYKYWSNSFIGGQGEYNLVQIEKNIYSIVRMPIFELVLVVIFSDQRKGQPACLIGPTKLVH